MCKLHNAFLNIRENTWQLYNVFLHFQDQVYQFYNVFLNKTASSPLLGGLILSTPHTVLPKTFQSNILSNTLQCTVSQFYYESGPQQQKGTRGMYSFY